MSSALITRRRALLGAGLLFLIPFVNSCSSGATPNANSSGATLHAKFGFTINGPRPGLEEFSQDIRRLEELGAGWVRFGVVGFQMVRNWSRSGQVVFDSELLDVYDQAFDVVESHGLGVCLLTVDGAPAQSNTPEYLDAMRQYWSTLGERFGQRTAVWQVFNEASHSDFRTPGEIVGDMDVYLADLSEALGVAREAILQHAPQVKLTTSANGYPVNDERESEWLRFFAGVGEHLDLCTLDLYPADSQKAISSMPERIATLERSASLPVSVGEFGLQTGPNLYTEEQQADSLAKSIAALSSSRASPVFVYRLRDDGAENDDGFGLYEIDGTPKSSLPKVAAAIDRWYPNG